METNIKLGEERHSMFFARCFGEMGLEYRHFKVSKINEKTVRCETIKEIGIHHIDGLIQKENYLKRAYFPTFEEARKWCYERVCKQLASWEEEIKGFTPLHPSYKRFLVHLQCAKECKGLLEDYSFEKHERFDKKFNDLYNSLKVIKDGHTS